MLNQAFEPTIDHSWIPSSTWRSLQFLEGKKLAQEKADFLDEVPVMSATVLGLEMLLNEPYIDLRSATELVLSDVGATIQILRLIGREYDNASERPDRMGDCLASLDVDAWFGAVSARTFVCDREHAAMTAFWKHCRLVAQYAQLVAESLQDIPPESAYLVGLLHGIGTIPTVLGLANGGDGAGGAGALFAMEGSLPLFVLAAMRSMDDSCPTSTWKVILTAAHELAGARTGCHGSTLHNIDSLGINSRWKRFLPALAVYISVAPGGPGLDAREKSASASEPSCLCSSDLVPMLA